MTTTDGNQYSFMQGAIKVSSVKTSSLASLFAVEAHNERVRVNAPDNSSRSDAQIIAGMRRAFAGPCTRVSLQWKEDSLVVLLMQPSMGILTLPCPRVVKHSASTRRRIFTYKISRLDESLPYLFLAAVNLHRTSLWGMVNLYLIMLIV